MAVDLYIMRHGEAQPIAPSDAARQLTKHGQQEVGRSAQYLSTQCSAQSVEGFDLVLVSPYVRAQQTWQIIKSVCGEPKQQFTVDDLVPEASPEQMHDFLDGLIAEHQPKNVLMVSHMPLVSYLVAELSVSQVAPIFMTAAVAHIRYDVQKMKGDFNGVRAPSLD